MSDAPDPAEAIRTKLPAVIKARRLELGLSQAHIASRLPVSQSTYARWENGSRVPSGTLIGRLLKLLRIDWSEIS